MYIKNNTVYVSRNSIHAIIMTDEVNKGALEKDNVKI